MPRSRTVSSFSAPGAFDSGESFCCGLLGGIATEDRLDAANFKVKMMEGFGLLIGHLIGDYIVQNDWMAANKTAKTLPCVVHCICYTLAIWACAFWWMPWWGLAICFVVHLPIDRWRLAKRWMDNVSGQKAFASGALSPWSIIVVDNTFHLTTLFAIGIAAG